MSTTEQLQITKPTLLQSKRDELRAKRIALIDVFQQAAHTNNVTALRRAYKRVLAVNDFISALDGIESESAASARPVSGVPRFTVSSLFLHECFNKLTEDSSEQFVFITGAEVGDACVLDQVIEMKHEKRTMMGVTADQRSTHKWLIRLEQFGHRLLAHFHSHPGNGPDSTHPSGTDENYQRRLETAGHIAVCAIFSRDGFIRFLRLDHNFEIEIYGKGVERYEQNVYRLTNID